MPYDPTKCQCLTGSGTQCTRVPEKGSDKCWQHKSNCKPVKPGILQKQVVRAPSPVKPPQQPARAIFKPSPTKAVSKPANAQLINLPPDILREMARGKPIKELSTFCQIHPKINTAVCNSGQFWRTVTPSKDAVGYLIQRGMKKEALDMLKKPEAWTGVQSIAEYMNDVIGAHDPNFFRDYLETAIENTINMQYNRTPIYDMRNFEQHSSDAVKSLTPDELAEYEKITEELYDKIMDVERYPDFDPEIAQILLDIIYRPLGGVIRLSLPSDKALIYNIITQLIDHGYGGYVNKLLLALIDYEASILNGVGLDIIYRNSPDKFIQIVELVSDTLEQLEEKNPNTIDWLAPLNDILFEINRLLSNGRMDDNPIVKRFRTMLLLSINSRIETVIHS